MSSATHPVLRELGLTRDIIRKYVVPAARQAGPAPAVKAMCPSRLGTRALREFRKANGLNTATGKPLVNQKHPDLAGLKGRAYNKAYSHRDTGTIEAGTHKLMIDSVSERAPSGADFKPSRRHRGAARDIGQSGDRLPPHSAEAEQGVLGCVLLSPNECLPVCLEKLGAGATAFYDLRHQVIHKMMVTMFDKREPVEMILLHHRLKDSGTLEQIGGIAYLNEIQDCVPSAANLSYYLDIVAEKHLLRRMIHTCTDVVGRVYDFDGEVDELLDEVERDVLRLAEDRVSGEQKNIKALVNQAIGTVENYFNRQGQISGLPTGFADLDRMTDGLHGGEMIVIAARPSLGKTSIAMNIAEHVVLNHVWTEETDDEHRAAAARAEGLKVTEV